LIHRRPPADRPPKAEPHDAKKALFVNFDVF
jgi:hypothetical protein